MNLQSLKNKYGLITNSAKDVSINSTKFIYAPLFKVGSENGELNNVFFSYLLEILTSHGLKLNIWKKRPLPNKTFPRAHVSMWAEIDDELIFFDKSDHIQEIDLNALAICSKYFKDNYNSVEISRVLKYHSCDSYFEKIKPFFPMANIGFFKRKFLDNLHKNIDLIQIMGLYTIPENFQRIEYRNNSPTGYDHGFIRYELYKVIKNYSGDLKFLCNLSTKDGSKSKLIDSKFIPKNRYYHLLKKSKFGIVNTIPHRILPWKFTEMISLGCIPVLDQKPLTQHPDIFSMKPDFHYIEIFPKISFFDKSLDSHPYALNSYRSLINDYSLSKIGSLFDKFINKIEKPEFISHIQENVLSFRDNVIYNKKLIFDYIINS